MGYADQVEHLIDQRLKEVVKERLGEILRYTATSVSFTETEKLASQCYAYGSGSDRIRAWWRMMCADAILGPSISFHRLASDQVNKYGDFFETQKLNSDKPLDALRSSDPAQVEQVYNRILGVRDPRDCWLGRTAYYNVSIDRKFFITERGYMSVGRLRLKSNDSVSIFPGVVKYL